MIRYLYLVLFTLSFVTSQNQTYSFGVRVSGHGKPMIFIPGYKGSADTYNEVVKHYAKNYTCYTITLAGFAGQPPSGAHDHLLLKQRDELIAFIEAKHLDHPVLVGFSFGGILAMWIATTRSDLCGRLIELDGTPFDAALGALHFDKDSLVRANGIRYAKAVDQPAEYWRKRDLAFHSPQSIAMGDSEVEKLVSDTNRIAETLVWDKASDFRSGALMSLESDTIDMRESVANINTPILVLGSWVSWGYKSKEDGEADYRRVYTKAKQLTIVFSDHGKHFLMYEDFDWMIDQMDHFLAQ